MYPVSITGDGVGRREFAADDVDTVLAVYGDPVVVEHLSFESRTRGQVAATLASVIEAAKEEPRREYSLAVLAAD